MKHRDGRRIGVWSLRIDAIYCALLGLFVAFSADFIGGVIAIPQPLLVVLGVVVVVWAALVLLMLAKMRIRLALQLVMGVNIVAALLVALCAVTAGTLLAVIAVLAIAIDVALFAASQAFALRRFPTAQSI